MDLAPFEDSDGSRSMAIEGSLGSGSMSHETHGYSADGVELSTAIVPVGWRERLVPFETEGTKPGRGWCLERHDLAVAKLIAGRPKDYEFVDALLDAGLLDLEVLRQHFDALPRDRAVQTAHPFPQRERRRRGSGTRLKAQHRDSDACPASRDRGADHRRPPDAT